MNTAAEKIYEEYLEAYILILSGVSEPRVLQASMSEEVRAAIAMGVHDAVKQLVPRTKATVVGIITRLLTDPAASAPAEG